MIRHTLKLTPQQIDKKARQLGLKKNKFGRWDTGDLCRELGLLEEYYLVLKKHIEVVPALHDHVVEVFEKLKKSKKKIGIISNSMQRTIRLYLQKYDLFGYIDFVFSQDDAGCRKDNERFWAELVKKEKLVVRECLVIGDDPVDDGEVPEKVGFNVRLIEKTDDLKNI